MSHVVGATKSPGMTHKPAPGKDPFTVPGYPQDMYMVMDEMAVKPETHGLRPGWTAGMQGMMTLVRVLEPALYDKIQRLKREQDRGRQS
ncbi:MAG: hypothetical protein M3R62_12825 [Acidobacteriota bacterium]|nr:hypothetical protein [Acidobacteriota bacterium]